MKKCFVLLATICLLMPALASAESDIYTLMDDKQNVIAYFCGECDVGDEYISQTNQLYRIERTDVSTRTAYAMHLGAAEMPDVSWLNTADSQPVISMGNKKIALYCTHSDESYIKGDGTESIDGKGGIYDIANEFAKALEELSVEVDLNETTHLPHDAGAYRRSRQTAVQLLKSQPNGIFDIHRDGLPDPDEYRTTVGGEEMSMVRLLVGKSNQNKEANLSFAKLIKAVADKIYPGLIKDIYMGKGSYNQDLAPRSVLLEFGTHTLPKEVVLNSVQPMSEVVYKALFGGVIGSAGASDTAPQKNRQSIPNERNEASANKDNTGASWGLWLVIALAGGLGLFAFLSTGGQNGMKKWGRSFSEMTGGLIGKKPPKDQE